MHTQLQNEFIKGKKWWGKESKVAERQRERGCVCVRVLVDTNGSVDQHPQTTWEEETHLAFY
jgi:hypothetical protein